MLQAINYFIKLINPFIRRKPFNLFKLILYHSIQDVSSQRYEFKKYSFLIKFIEGSNGSCAPSILSIVKSIQKKLRFKSNEN